jgi:hypothetical protein
MRWLAVVALSGLLVPPLLAQAGPKLERPASWKVRFDRPGAAPRYTGDDLEPNAGSAIRYVTMPPGWHITTGPAAILYDPEWTASGAYRVEMESFLFPVERAEGFGLFFGGRDLEGDGQAYTYFLIRKDGRYLIKARDGGTTKTLVPWTEHPAIVRHEGEGTAKNILAIDVGPQEVTFSVNGQRVTSLARAALDTDGTIGLRVNHALNLHVTRVDITPATR